MSAATQPYPLPAPDADIRGQFAETMYSVGLTDERLVVMVGDISHFALQPFAEACPGRYYNIGICEPASVSIAAGLSQVGLVPVFHTIAPFIVERSFEQIKLDFCYQQLGGNLVTVGSAFDYANLGVTHHCYSDFALLKTLPNVEVIHPGSGAEFDLLFRQSYRNDKLSYFKIPGTPHGIAIDPDEILVGRAVRIARGDNLTIIVTGAQLASAAGATEILRQAGWRSDILYVHTITPLDIPTIRESVARTGRVIVVEEHMRNGGLGDSILQSVHDLQPEFASLAIPNQFVSEYGSYQEHCEALGFTPAGILQSVQDAFGAP
jgi:transketolase